MHALFKCCYHRMKNKQTEATKNMGKPFAHDMWVYSIDSEDGFMTVHLATDTSSCIY